MKTTTLKEPNSSSKSLNVINLELCFKNLVARFRLLHLVKNILTKIGKPTLSSFSFLEKTIFNNLKFLKTFLDKNNSEVKALNINAIIRSTERHLSQYNQQVIDKYDSLSVLELRQNIDNSRLQKSELAILSQFEFYLHSNNEVHHQKLELMLTRLAINIDKLEDTKNLILSLFDKNIYISQLIKPNSANEMEFIDSLTNINSSISKLESFDDLILKKNLDKFRQIKKHLKNDFWNLNILTNLIFTNTHLHNYFDFSLDKEYEEIKEAAANLISHGIDYIPKINGEKNIDVTNVYRFVCKINKMMTQDYQANDQKLFKLAYLHKLLTQAAGHLNDKSFSSSFLASVKGEKGQLVEHGWKIVENQAQNSIQTPPTSFSKNTDLCNVEIKPFEKHLDEEQLNSYIEYITKVLDKRKLNGKNQIIKLKYFNLVLNNEEVMTFLGCIPSSIFSLEEPKLLARRALAIYSHLKDAFSFYQNKINLLNFSLGIYGMSNLKYYWSQGKDTIDAIDRYIKKLNQSELAVMSGLVFIREKLNSVIEEFPSFCTLAKTA